MVLFGHRRGFKSVGHQHHLSRRKSYDRAVTALKEQASRRKKIAIEYQLLEFDNVLRALQDAGITVTFDKPNNKPALMSEYSYQYSYHLLGVEWSNKHGKYEQTLKPYPVTLNWDYVDMTL